jgi:arylsulfatase A-like enzyme
MDWYPTILDLCGIEKNKSVSFDGKSLVPMLRGKGNDEIHNEFHWAWQKQWAVRVGDWKLIGRGSWDLKSGQKIPSGTHLGNVSEKDPEKKNYVSERKDLLKELKEVHDRWAKTVGFSAR